MRYVVYTVALSALLVGAPLAASAAPANAAQAASASDSDITARVKSQIDAQSDFKGMEVEVSTAQGVVTLKGVAPSPLARAKVGELTKSTEGVTKVINKMTLSK